MFTITRCAALPRLVGLLFAVVAWSTPALATTYYVTLSGRWSNSGLSPSEPTLLFRAVELAGDGDVIMIGRGRFDQLPIDTMGKALTFKGTTGTIFNTDFDYDGMGDSQILFCTTNETSATRFEDICFMSGGGLWGAHGGAVYLEGASPTFVRCDFIKCHATGNGGAIYVGPGSSPTFEDCGFLQNASDYGGAIYVAPATSASNRSTVTLRNCAFWSNAAQAGGAIFGSGTFEIRDSNFQDNTVNRDTGAAIEIEDSLGNSIVTGSDFLRNKGPNAVAVIARGADIYLSHFEENTMGIFIEDEGEVAECTFERNEEDGIRAVSYSSSDAGPVTIRNCTFTENLAGAVQAESYDHLSITGCNFLRNGERSGSPYRGVLAVRDLPGGSVLVRDCYFGQNDGGAIETHTYAEIKIELCELRENSGAGVGMSGIGAEILSTKICGSLEGQVVDRFGVRHDAADGTESWDVGENCFMADCNDDIDMDGTADCYDPCPTFPPPYGCDGPTVITVPVGWPIQRAIDMVPDGGMVILDAGEHHIWHTLDFGDKKIVFQGPEPSGDLRPQVTLNADVNDDGVGDRQILQVTGGQDYLTLIRYITFKNGSAAYGGTTNGGAVKIVQSGPRFDYCLFENCRASGSGGAIFIEGGGDMPHFHHCWFEYNTAGVDGGAVASASGLELPAGPIQFSDCVLLANIASNGGAISNRLASIEGVSMQIDGSTFDENNAAHGGAIYSADLANTGFAGCRLRNNIANVGLGGGAESGFGSGHLFLNTYFCGNQAAHLDGSWLDLGGNIFDIGCQEQTSGDLNEDGNVDGQDLGALIGMWGLCLDQPCVGDLDGDGQVGGTDLAILIGAWSQ